VIAPASVDLDVPALSFADVTWSYGKLHRRVGTTAALLRAIGIERGDRVAVAAPNHPQTFALLFACARLGAILVPLNIRLSPAEMGYCLADCGARVLVASHELAATIDDLAVETVVAPDSNAWVEARPVPSAVGSDADAVLIVYTSGTTGRPKGAVLSQRALAANTVNSIHFHDLVASDVVLTAAPLFHVGGLNIQSLPALMTGAHVVLHERFDPGAWLNAVAKHRPTLSVLVPAMMRAVVSHPDWASTDLSSLRSITTGSSMVPAPLIEAFHLRHVPVCQVYGLTESSPIAVHQKPADALTHVGSTGVEAKVTELRIVDGDGHDVVDGASGELLLRGPNLFDGYWGNPDATAAVVDADGWFRTGDVGRREADGHVTILDRTKDMIISGGENVYPAEIEQVLASCAAVADVAVVGAPDDRWGEVPVAVVVARGEPDERAVLAHCTERLARFKHPQRVVFVDALPRNAMGKLLKHEIRASL
jgi:fatty-acyl-CoA synthase